MKHEKCCPHRREVMVRYGIELYACDTPSCLALALGEAARTLARAEDRRLMLKTRFTPDSKPARKKRRR